jgi:hypothetical protein
MRFALSHSQKAVFFSVVNRKEKGRQGPLVYCLVFLVVREEKGKVEQSKKQTKL